MYKGLAFIALILFFILPSCSSKKEIRSELLKGSQIPQPKQESGPPTLFVLGEGDEISINVWRQEDLKKEMLIDPSGYIYLPLIGEIKAAGQTIPQLTDEITRRLSRFIINPLVDISLAGVRSHKVIVLGEVRTPGSYVLDQKISALEAISKGGGFTTSANKQNVLLVRNEENDVRVQLLDLDITELEEGSNLDYQMTLLNGDILYVPEVNIASIERFMTRVNTILAPFINTPRGIILYKDMYDRLLGISTDNVIVAP